MFQLVAVGRCRLLDGSVRHWTRASGIFAHRLLNFLGFVDSLGPLPLVCSVDKVRHLARSSSFLLLLQDLCEVENVLGECWRVRAAATSVNECLVILYLKV